MNKKIDNTKYDKRDENIIKTSTSNDINQLKERVKELNCLYGLTKIVKDSKLSIGEALQKIVELLPPSWQYPDLTCTRINLDKREFKTNNFKETKWSQISNIIADNNKIGVLEVYYLKEKPLMDEGPFLIEERRLIDAVSDFIGEFIKERRTKEELEHQRKKLDYAEKIMSEGEKKRSSDAEIIGKKQDWEVIIDLLIKTDPRTLLRITRKMTYYLYRYENEKITELLNMVCPVDRDSSTTQWCGINMPNPRQDLETLENVQKQVFEIAKECLSPEEISELFHEWMRQDKARPLLLTSQKTGVPLADITDEISRFFDKSNVGAKFAKEDKMGIKTALIRRFFTGRLKQVNVAKKFIEVEDFVSLLEHVIGPAQGTGKLGGKTSGIYLAEKIIKEEMKTDELLEDISFPRSWYVISDTILNFIHFNDLDEVFHQKYLDPNQVRQEQPFL